MEPRQTGDEKMETTKTLTQIKRDAIRIFQDAIIVYGEKNRAELFPDETINTATFCANCRVKDEMWAMLKKITGLAPQDNAQPVNHLGARAMSARPPFQC